MRAIGHILQHRATVSRMTRSLVDGQVIEALAVVGTLPCRLTSPSRGGLVVYAGAEEAPRNRICYFLPAADVRADDRLTIGGARFRVIDAETQPDGVYRHASVELDLAVYEAPPSQVSGSGVFEEGVFEEGVFA